jgi:hypothetical protein
VLFHTDCGTAAAAAGGGHAHGVMQQQEQQQPSRAAYVIGMTSDDSSWGPSSPGDCDSTSDCGSDRSSISAAAKRKRSRSGGRDGTSTPAADSQ